MTDFAGRYGVSLLLAALVHGLALWALVAEWSIDADDVRVMPRVPTIQAKLVEMKAQTPKVAPPPSRPPPPPAKKPEPKPVERAAIEKKPQKVNKKPEPKPAPAKPNPQPAKPNIKELEQQALQQAISNEVAQLDALAGADMVQSFADRIRQMIEQNWSRPPSAKNGMQTELVIELVPTGEVVNVNVIRSSGDEPFDRAAVAAVMKVRRFEVPEESRLFEQNFRRFRLLFNPEDLLR